MVFSNASIYKDVVEEAYLNMCSLSEDWRTLNKGDSCVCVLKYDPTHGSFKQSMIVIVFASMWLEAILHQLIVCRHGADKFKQYDRKNYREKLVLLGVTDSDLLDKVDSLRITRRGLVHEKAFSDKGEFTIAQKEAELAYQVMLNISYVLDI